MRFSLRLNNDHPAQDYVRWAVQAEQFGFDQFWVSNDLFYRSAPVILTAAAAATRRIEIGTCILNPYTIHPAEIAMIATTLDEVSNGRFNLGLSSGAADFLGWVGTEPHKPRTAVVETVEAVRQLMTGQSAAREGEFLTWSAEAHMRFSPFRRAPVYIGAMSSRMCAEIGRVADGGLPLLFPPEHYVQVIQWIEDGARQAGRSMSEIDVAACIWCSVSDNQAQAEDALKEKIAYYGHAMSATILEQLGLTHADFREIERLVMIEKNIEAAKRLVTEPMMRIGIAGSADKLIERLEQLAALGVQHISFGPPLGPDIDEAIRVIGQQIIPHFR